MTGGTLSYGTSGVRSICLKLAGCPSAVRADAPRSGGAAAVHPGTAGGGHRAGGRGTRQVRNT